MPHDEFHRLLTNRQAGIAIRGGDAIGVCRKDRRFPAEVRVTFAVCNWSMGIGFVLVMAAFVFWRWYWGVAGVAAWCFFLRGVCDSARQYVSALMSRDVSFYYDMMDSGLVKVIVRPMRSQM
jgi:hypothetical protein